MMALVIVPDQYVPSLFVGLGQELSDAEHNELVDLFKYFNDYWMCKYQYEMFLTFPKEPII
jgi:hypothetical protein